MSQLTRPSFYLSAFERALKTAAQTAVVLIGADSFDVITADWAALVSLSAGAAIVSVLTSVASLPVGEPGTPSAV